MKTVVDRARETLGYSPGDELDAVKLKRDWRERVFKIHPDAGGDLDTWNRMLDAYKVLLEYFANAPCATCNGTGRVERSSRGYSVSFVCPDCRGLQAKGKTV